MHEQHATLVEQTVANLRRLSLRRVDGQDAIAEDDDVGEGFGGEREDVRGRVLVAPFAVESAYVRVGAQRDGELGVRDPDGERVAGQRDGFGGRVDEPTDERARVILERGGEGVHGKGVVVGAGRAAVLVDDQDVHANLRRAVHAALAHQKGHVGDVEVVVDERVLVVVVVERVHVVVVVLGRMKARVGR